MQGVKFVSQVSYCGYRQAARGYLRGLRAAGIPVTWTPMVDGRSWGLWMEPFEGAYFPDADFGDIVNRSIDYDTVLVHLVPEYFPQWRVREPDKTMIGITVWEFEQLPPHWPQLLNQMDALIVPCHWNREAFRKGGVNVPIAVIPHVQVQHNAGQSFQIAGVQPGDFVFYTISTWDERKAPHLTLMGYLSAFTASDPVVLAIKTMDLNERLRRPGLWWKHVTRHLATSRREIERIRHSSGSSARLAVITDSLTDGEMEAFAARGDCYVSLTRSEGWGLGAYQAAFAGKPVIITGHGGQLDYLPVPLAYHVGYQMAPCNARSDMPAGALRWAEPDLAHGARLMQEVFARPQEARQRGLRLQKFVQENFAAERIMADMLAFVKSVSG